MMGNVMSHFFVGVYWAPPSICSHSVSSSYAPPWRSDWNGIPVAQWKTKYENYVASEYCHASCGSAVNERNSQVDKEDLLASS